MGCGAGSSTTQLSPHFSRVVGTDINWSQIQEAELSRTGIDGGCSQIEQAESTWSDNNLAYR